MKYEEYIEKLNEMYDEQYGVGTCQGVCEHWEKCKPDEPVKFQFDRVKVGKEYGIKYPKILFSGLEGKFGEVENYRIQEIDEPSLEVDNSHYRGVRYTLSYLLSKIENKNVPQGTQIEMLNGDEYVEHLKHYCLTNIYKCAFGEPTQNRGLPHTKSMKTNCYKIFLKEIDILRPEIVVIQCVSDLPYGLWKSMKEQYSVTEKDIEHILSSDDEDKTSAYKLHYDDGTPFYVVWTYHGSWFTSRKAYIENHLKPVLDATVESYLETKQNL